MPLRVRVVAFARLRELLDGSEHTLELPDDACVSDAWSALAARVPELEGLASSTRIARNGRLSLADEPLADGDELAMLPPVGGG